MHKNGKRQAGLVISKFNDEIDLIEANDFIKEWLGYGIVICANKRKSKNYIDRDCLLSSVLEGLYTSFISLERKFEKPWSEPLKKKSYQYL